SNTQRVPGLTGCFCKRDQLTRAEESPMQSGLFTFVGGEAGSWRVVKMAPVVGAPLEVVARLEVVSGNLECLPRGGKWLLRGVTSYERYVTRHEQDALIAHQPPLGRPDATC